MLNLGSAILIRPNWDAISKIRFSFLSNYFINYEIPNWFLHYSNEEGKITCSNDGEDFLKFIYFTKVMTFSENRWDHGGYAWHRNYWSFHMCGISDIEVNVNCFNKKYHLQKWPWLSSCKTETWLKRQKSI